MAIETFNGGHYVITGNDTKTYRLLVLRNALKMEIKGLKLSSHRPTAYSIIKKEFDLKGSKTTVLADFEEILVNEYDIKLTNLCIQK